ncbi:hypothetical protein FB451DRAFT_1362975 [Mycena latifolia]|nr:hypothetical protein FB451DRAFT_1362975 [Mycena latifolia]
MAKTGNPKCPEFLWTAFRTEKPRFAGNVTLSCHSPRKGNLFLNRRCGMVRSLAQDPRSWGLRRFARGLCVARLVIATIKRCASCAPLAAKYEGSTDSRIRTGSDGEIPQATRSICCLCIVTLPALRHREEHGPAATEATRLPSSQSRRGPSRSLPSVSSDALPDHTHHRRRPCHASTVISADAQYTYIVRASIMYLHKNEYSCALPQSSLLSVFMVYCLRAGNWACTAPLDRSACLFQKLSLRPNSGR